MTCISRSGHTSINLEDQSVFLSLTTSGASWGFTSAAAAEAEKGQPLVAETETAVLVGGFWPVR